MLELLQSFWQGQEKLCEIHFVVLTDDQYHQEFSLHHSSHAFWVGTPQSMSLWSLKTPLITWCKISGTIISCMSAPGKKSVNGFYVLHLVCLFCSWWQKGDCTLTVLLILKSSQAVWGSRLSRMVHSCSAFWRIWLPESKSWDGARQLLVISRKLPISLTTIRHIWGTSPELYQSPRLVLGSRQHTQQESGVRGERRRHHSPVAFPWHRLQQAAPRCAWDKHGIDSRAFDVGPPCLRCAWDEWWEDTQGEFALGARACSGSP